LYEFCLGHGSVVVLGLCHAPERAVILDEHGKSQELQSRHAPKQNQNTRQKVNRRAEGIFIFINQEIHKVLTSSPKMLQYL